MIDESNITPINEKKIESLASAYKKIPKNRFSKGVVIFCLGISTFSIIVSFILLLIGINASEILNPSLIFWGSELFIMGAKATFSREERAQDIIFDTITHDVQDGKLYNKNTGQIIATEEEYATNINEEDIVDENDSDSNNDDSDNNNDDNSDDIIEKQLPKKKRGRPKKVQVESVQAENVQKTPESKKNFKIGKDGNIELISD